MRARSPHGFRAESRPLVQRSGMLILEEHVERQHRVAAIARPPLSRRHERLANAAAAGFRCDDDACPGHTLACTDWEMGEAWRQWRDKYGEAGWEEKFRQRFEAEMIEKYDTHFYVGTVHHHPSTWIVVGLFYPPQPKLQAQGTLPGLDSN